MTTIEVNKNATPTRLEFCKTLAKGRRCRRGAPAQSQREVKTRLLDENNFPPLSINFDINRYSLPCYSATHLLQS
jgi:hypothetical protein